MLIITNFGSEDIKDSIFIIKANIFHLKKLIHRSYHIDQIHLIFELISKYQLSYAI